VDQRFFCRPTMSLGEACPRELGVVEEKSTACWIGSGVALGTAPPAEQVCPCRGPPKGLQRRPSELRSGDRHHDHRDGVPLLGGTPLLPREIRQVASQRMGWAEQDGGRDME
jgi:hypothetical protein